MIIDWNMFNLVEIYRNNARENDKPKNTRLIL